MSTKPKTARTAAPAAAPLTFVTGASTRVTIEIDGQKVALRPLTFAEVGDLAMEEAADYPPSPAVIADAVRTALRALSPAPEALDDYLTALDEHEAADDAVQALHAARPVAQEPPEAFAAHRGELEAAYKTVLSASGRRQRGEWLVRHDATLKDLRSQAARHQRQRGLRILALSIETWGGQGALAWPEDVEARLALLPTLPEPWLNKLLPAATKLTNPGVAEAKNS